MAGVDFQSTLQAGAGRLQIDLPQKGLDRLEIYYRELKKWSGKFNLIAKGSTDTEIIEKHFLDSLALLPLLAGPDVHLLDIGTGAGFPGMVVAAVQPAIKVTLVEPRLKRVTFLNHIVRTLELNNVVVVGCRSEDEASLPSDVGATHITSRAVAEIDDFLKLSARFCRQGSEVVCMKGPKWEEELDRAELETSYGTFQKSAVLHYELPFSGASRTLVRFSLIETGHG